MQDAFVGGVTEIIVGALTSEDISGTSAVECVEPPDAYIGGTLDVDESVARAWVYPRVTLDGEERKSDRLTSARVTLDGAEVPSLVGTVVLKRELDNLIESAEFEIADPRVARFHPSTYSWGEKDCTVTFIAGPNGGVQEWGAFTGRTESPANAGAYRPRGRYAAVGSSADWADKDVCVLHTAKSGTRRGALVIEALASVGATTDTPNLAEMGKVMNRPVSVMGIKAGDFLKRVGLMEGWRFVTINNVVSIIDEDTILDGPSLFDFDEETIAQIEEIPPTRPVLKAVLTGTILSDESKAVDGQYTVKLPIEVQTDSNGNPFWTEVVLTKEKETVLRKVSTDYGVIEPDGVATGPATLQAITRTEVEYTWYRIDTAYGHEWSTQLLKTVARRYEVTGTPAATDNGSAYDWVGGGRYVEQQAKLMLVEEIVTDNVWNNLDCLLKSSVTVRSEYYSPLADSATGHLYTDEQYRSSLAYTWRETGRSTTRWADYRNANVGALPEVVASTRVQRYIPTGKVTTFIETYVDAEVVRREWLADDASNTSWTLTTTTSKPPGLYVSTDGIVPPPGTTTEHGSGPVPGPPNGSEDVPQYAQTPFEITIDHTADYPFGPVQQAETLELAEDIDEVEEVGERIVARSLATMYRIQSRSIPFMVPGWHVTVKHRARSITTPKDGYVLDIEHTHSVDPDAPGGTQVTTVVVPL